MYKVFQQHLAQRPGAWRQAGIWLAKTIDLKLNLQVQNQL